MNNDKMPSISVVMSVKNGANYLQKSIDSILNQTFSDFELIICNDGSTDNTQEILDKYSRLDERIVLICNDESRGLAFSLNRCINISRSNIIARQDADDASATNRFEIQYPFVIGHPEYAIVGTCWYDEYSDGRMIEEVVPLEPTARDQAFRGLYMHPTWMMRKDQIQKVGFYTANKYTLRDQDYHLVMKILGAGMKLYNMQEFLYYYRVDENQRKRQLNWSRVPGLMWIKWDSFRRNKMPFWMYIIVLKPLVVHLIPKKLMLKYYDRHSKKKS